MVGMKTVYLILKEAVAKTIDLSEENELKYAGYQKRGSA